MQKWNVPYWSISMQQVKNIFRLGTNVPTHSWQVGKNFEEYILTFGHVYIALKHHGTFSQSTLQSHRYMKNEIWFLEISNFTYWDELRITCISISHRRRRTTSFKMSHNFIKGKSSEYGQCRKEEVVQKYILCTFFKV